MISGFGICSGFVSLELNSAKIIFTFGGGQIYVRDIKVVFPKQGFMKFSYHSIL